MKLQLQDKAEEPRLNPKYVLDLRDTKLFPPGEQNYLVSSETFLLVWCFLIEYACLVVIKQKRDHYLRYGINFFTPYNRSLSSDHKKPKHCPH